MFSVDCRACGLVCNKSVFKLHIEFYVGWLILFYPQGPRKEIFVSSKAHVSPHIASDQGDPYVVRPESRTQVIYPKGEEPNHCPTISQPPAGVRSVISTWW